MTASGVGSLGLVPKLTPLETSQSIRRALISPQASPLSRSKCSTPTELPVVSENKTPGDDHCFQWTSRLSWFACFLFVTFVAVIILGTHPFFNNSKTLSLGCSKATRSSSSPRADQQLPVEVQNSQANRFDGDGTGSEKVDEKCWSRTRQWMYRPSERRFPPSASLTRAMEEYESLHARCTVGKKWESFEEITKSGNSQDSCKYLIYIEGPEGLGNRFLSIVSAFAYALVTNRVLLLDSRRNMSSLICEPFQRSSWALPTTFPFEKVDQLPSLNDIENIEELEKMDAIRLNLRHRQSERDQRFFCADTQERLNKVTLVGWASNLYHLPRLFTMPEIWEKLTPLFDDPSLVFTQLGRILLLPQNEIWARTERIYRAYLASSRTLVGMQVRTPRTNDFEQPIQDRMMQCLTSHQILPEISQQPSGFNVVTTKIPEEGTTLLVTSLQRAYYEHLFELYINRGAEDGTPVTVRTMDSLGFEEPSHEQAIKAFMDILLLSFSDSLATSGWSTFGYLAQGFGAIIPRIVDTDIYQSEACVIGQSFEPCTHFPAFASCPATNNEIPEHVEWIKRHVRSCQDQPEGIQLVSTAAS